MKIDVDKLITSLMRMQNEYNWLYAILKMALKDQGLEYKDGAIVEKIEPKFKVGNWYQCTKNFFGKGVTFDKNTAYYCAKEGCLQDEYGCHIAIVEVLYDNFKLWTIQDAKDGDVLYLQKDGKEHIIIYKGVIKERFRTFVSAYCAYNGIVDAFCFADVSRYVDIAYGGIMPVTKEQRVLLFQKMQEAGYEWDAEKKELKKVEQNPAKNSGKPSENVIEKEDMTEYNKGFECGKQRVLKYPEDFGLCKNFAWSEEDEEMSKEVLTDIIYAKNDLEAKECLGLSKRAMKAFNWFSKRYKSLISQNTWRPTKEQMEALEKHLIFLQRMNAFGENIDRLKDLYNDLKKLREG